MKILVCGCSYFTTDSNWPNTHFTEIIAEKLNANLINLAERGSSNFAIRLQVQSCYEIKPDLVILGFTFPDRIEHNFNNKKYNSNMHVHNLKYNQVREFLKDQYASIQSDPMPALIKSDTELSPVVKNYVKYFYNYELQKHKDYLIAQTALYFLKTNNIPFVFSEAGLGSDNLGLFKDFKNNWVKSGNPWPLTSKGEKMWQRVYHTQSEEQIKLAEIWLKKIKELYNFV